SLQADGTVINRMEINESINHRLTEATVEVWTVKIDGRHLFANHQSTPALHHKKRRAKDSRVLTKEKRARRWGKNWPECRQHPKSSRHIVRARCDGTTGWSAQYILVITKPYEVREIGVTAGELHNFERTVCMRQTVA